MGFTRSTPFVSKGHRHCGTLGKLTILQVSFSPSLSQRSVPTYLFVGHKHYRRLSLC